jgi:hypothetical protein
MHFRGNANEMLYGSPNLVNPSKKVFHIQDFSHNVKKLRNSILKSGDMKGIHTRKINNSTALSKSFPFDKLSRYDFIKCNISVFSIVSANSFLIFSAIFGCRCDSVTHKRDSYKKNAALRKHHSMETVGNGCRMGQKYQW